MSDRLTPEDEKRIRSAVEFGRTQRTGSWFVEDLRLLLAELDAVRAELEEAKKGPAAMLAAVRIWCGKTSGAAANAVREDYPELCEIIDNSKAGREPAAAGGAGKVPRCEDDGDHRYPCFSDVLETEEDGRKWAEAALKESE